MEVRKKRPYAPRRMYTEEDIQFLKENYGKMSIEEMAMALQRSKNNIASKLHTLGITKKRTMERNAERRRKDAFIEKHFYTMDIYTLSKSVGLTPASVYRRHRDNLAKEGKVTLTYRDSMNPYTPEDIELIRKWYPIEGSACNTRLSFYHSQGSVRVYARMYGIRYKGPDGVSRRRYDRKRLIDTPENREFIKKNVRNGKNYTWCAEQLNCSSSTVRKIYKNMQLTEEELNNAENC